VAPWLGLFRLKVAHIRIYRRDAVVLYTSCCILSHRIGLRPNVWQLLMACQLLNYCVLCDSIASLKLWAGVLRFSQCKLLTSAGTCAPVFTRLVIVLPATARVLSPAEAVRRV
jgi:hypothetical protein